jgi:hypothetical protein
MADVNIRLNLEFTPRLFRAFLPLLLLSVMAGDLASEAVTLNTYYPAPSGIYTQMIAAGNTYLARDSGCVQIGTTAGCGGGARVVVMGNSGTPNWVGFGTLAPGAPLEVAHNPTNVGGEAVRVNGQILIGDASGGGGVFFTADTSVAPLFIGPSGTNLLMSNGVNTITIAPVTGFVGIGTASPVAPLDVTGTMEGRTWDLTTLLP